MPNIKKLLNKLRRWYHSSKTGQIAVDQNQAHGIQFKIANEAKTQVPLKELPKKISDDARRIAAGNEVGLSPVNPTEMTEDGHCSAAGNETAPWPVYPGENGDDMSEGPILQTGLTRKAFSRRLENQLRRGLGLDYEDFD